MRTKSKRKQQDDDAREDVFERPEDTLYVPPERPPMRQENTDVPYGFHLVTLREFCTKGKY